MIINLGVQLSTVRQNKPWDLDVAHWSILLSGPSSAPCWKANTLIEKCTFCFALLCYFCCSRLCLDNITSWPPYYHLVYRSRWSVSQRECPPWGGVKYTCVAKYIATHVYLSHREKCFKSFRLFFLSLSHKQKITSSQICRFTNHIQCDDTRDTIANKRIWQWHSVDYLFTSIW